MANQACADGDERFMDVGTSLIAHAQTSEAMQPGDGPFDHPAGEPQATAMFGVAPGNLGADSQFAQLLSMRLGVVSTVGLDELRTMARMPWLARDRRNRLDQGDQLGDIVGIGSGENHSERNALRIDREVVL